MPTTARVVVLEGDYGVCAIQELELPDPSRHQAVVEIYGAGIEHGQLQQIEEPQATPIIPGREGTARVLEVGSAVTRVKVDDTVLVTPTRAEPNREAELPTIEFDDGTVTEAGPTATWGTNAVIDEQFLVPIPDLPDKEGATVLGHTTMLAAAAVRTAGVATGESVAVFGCAGAGLSVVAAAAAAGASTIIAIDRSEARLEAAGKLGATATLNLSSAAAVQKLAELVPGGVAHLFDCVYEFEAGERPGRAPVRDGGSALVVASPGTEARRAELDALISHYGYAEPDSPDPDRDTAALLAWLDAGKLDVSVIVSNRFTIEQVNEATQLLENGEIAGQTVMVVEPMR